MQRDFVFRTPINWVVVLISLFSITEFVVFEDVLIDIEERAIKTLNLLITLPNLGRKNYEKNA